jgi:hypothetical protein
MATCASWGFTAPMSFAIVPERPSGDYRWPTDRLRSGVSTAGPKIPAICLEGVIPAKRADKFISHVG